MSGRDPLPFDLDALRDLPMQPRRRSARRRPARPWLLAVVALLALA